MGLYVKDVHICKKLHDLEDGRLAESIWIKFKRERKKYRYIKTKEDGKESGGSATENWDGVLLYQVTKH